MAQRQMTTRLPHDDTTRTHGDDMQLGDNNMHEDDDVGPGPPTNSDEAHHSVMSHFPSPLPFIPLPFILLPFIPLPFTIPLPNTFHSSTDSGWNPRNPGIPVNPVHLGGL